LASRCSKCKLHQGLVYQDGEEFIVFKTCGVVCAALLLTACGAPKPREELQRGATETAIQVQPPTGAGVYRIDSARSELRLLVYRAGPLARLGHNHVIVNRAVGGWVKFAGNAVAASFSLRVPAADFVVDDAGMRSEEGTDFSEDVTEDAKSGTRHNMLSAALLDAEHFPAIMLVSTAVTQTSGMLAATMSVGIAGHQSTLVIPFTLETSAGRLSASGTAVLRQSAMGLTPFSVMLGALQVQDELTVKFSLVAVRS
jgi:polyisoprenoid-binding protein YceI